MLSRKTFYFDDKKPSKSINSLKTGYMRVLKMIIYIIAFTMSFFLSHTEAIALSKTALKVFSSLTAKSASILRLSFIPLLFNALLKTE